MIGLEHIYIYSVGMNITQKALQELTEVIEDTVEYACDQHMLSGECAWTVVQCLAVTKLHELEGLLKK